MSAAAAIIVAVSSCGNAGRVNLGYQDEIVDMGYQSVTRKRLSNAASTIEVKQNEQHYSNIYEYLRAKVSGVEVTPNNKIYIRGQNSIISSTDPLILVDGAEMYDISSLNPNDVATITVLKDASTTIYGTRGANGVIIIKTKVGGQ